MKLGRNDTLRLGPSGYKKETVAAMERERRESRRAKSHAKRKPSKSKEWNDKFKALCKKYGQKPGTVRSRMAGYNGRKPYTLREALRKPPHKGVSTKGQRQWGRDGFPVDNGGRNDLPKQDRNRND